MLAEQAVAIVIIGAGAARADKAAVLAQPCLSLIQIVSAALHLCAQMPDAESLARWEKLRTAQLERMRAKAEKQAAEK